MLCFENGKKLEKFDINAIFKNLTAKATKSYICCVNHGEFTKLDMESDYNAKTLEEFEKNAVVKFANDDHYDILYVDIPHELASPNNVDSSVFYVSKNILIIVYKPLEKCNFENLLENCIKKSYAPGKVLPALLDLFTRKDSRVLGKIEEEITAMEAVLLSENRADKKDYAKEIAAFRKTLLELKNYYDQLFDAFEEFEQNENTVFTESELLYCGNIMGRITRLLHTVLGLREYVSQVREAYQTQVDISLNVTMKIFTVIAAIFLPLMFITSWYGMNMPMPEIGLKVTYYVVMGLCASIMIGCIIYFKKKKWF